MQALLLAFTLSFFELSHADRIAVAWNSQQETHACKQNVPVADEGDDKKLGASYSRSEVCPSQARRFPPEIPEGYYPKFSAEDGQGWVLIKATQGVKEGSDHGEDRN